MVKISVNCPWQQSCFNVKIKAMKYLIIIALIALSLVSLNVYTGSKSFTSEDADKMNQIDSKSEEELLKLCQELSPWSYVSGLTDGAFVPFGGRTYYYRSRCFNELAKRSLNPSYCKEVKRRYSLLGKDDLSYDNCILELQKAVRRKENDELKAQFVKSLKASAHKIIAASFKKNGLKNWSVNVVIEGNQDGDYAIEGKNLSSGKVFLNERISLKKGRLEHNLPLQNSELLQCNLCPVALSLTLLTQTNPLLTSIHNLNFRP